MSPVSANHGSSAGAIGEGEAEMLRRVAGSVHHVDDYIVERQTIAVLDRMATEAAMPK